jgi:16S rRNA C967 or C1407 C5-methylase (RsmB/RsmF family)/NOL1/NOP2/fmu family ribosome biogenesis protein
MNVDRLSELLGEARLPAAEVRELAASVQEPALPTVRLNQLGRRIEAGDLPFSVRPIPWFPQAAYRLESYHRVAGHPLFATGAYFVQDAASLLAVRLLDPQPGELVLDLCAAPGGKSTALLDALGNRGSLLANEVVRNRIPPLLLNLARHGSGRYIVSGRDPRQLADTLGDQFDAVLVDAPCSGQTLFGRDKQDDTAFDGKVIEGNAIRQARLLAAAARLVKPGGRLVYSTCTFSFAENEARVADLLADREDFRADSVEALSEYASSAPESAGCYRLFPHRHDGSGAFAARLVREGAGYAHQNSPRPLIETQVGLRYRHQPDVDWAQWGRWSAAPQIYRGGNSLFTLPEALPNRALKAARSGPEVVFRKGETWFPAYALAMRRDGGFVPAQTIEVDEADAAKYLAGQPLEAKAQGWTVLTYRELPLGWGKGSGREMKNHLPKSARLVVAAPG